MNWCACAEDGRIEVLGVLREMSPAKPTLVGQLDDYIREGEHAHGLRALTDAGETSVRSDPQLLSRRVRVKLGTRDPSGAAQDFLDLLAIPVSPNALLVWHLFSLFDAELQIALRPASRRGRANAAQRSRASTSRTY